MNPSSNEFLLGEAVDIEVVDDKLSRQVLGYGPHIMMVKVWFKQGGVGELHRHPHAQTTYIESGEFEVSIGGKIETLRGGDAFYIPPNIEHGALCKKAGILIDVFSPAREDFLTGE